MRPNPTSIQRFVAILTSLFFVLDVHAHKTVPYVHGWILYNALELLPEGPKKAEMYQYLSGLPTGVDPYEYFFSRNSVFSLFPAWEDAYEVPLLWKADGEKTGTSLMEGVWEEDEDSYAVAKGDSVIHHFWNPVPDSMQASPVMTAL
jgi:hypothetical protein